MSKSGKPIDGQGAFFTPGIFTGEEYIKEPPSTPNIGTTEPEIGPHTNIIERGNNLALALGELAHSSMLFGLKNVSDYTGGRRKLEARYGDVDSLVGRSEDAKDAHALAAQRAFEKASGLSELIDSVGEDEARKIIGGMYREFVERYADAKGAKNRKILKGVLKKQQQVIQEANKRPKK
jgi:hypothetical protein